jgi:hypothetical protein
MPAHSAFRGESLRLIRQSTALLSAALLVGIVTGCASTSTAENVQVTPSPTVKTEAEYISDLTEFKDASTLTLKVGASADEFGKWIVDLNDKWHLGSCDRASDIVDAAVQSNTDATTLRTDLATANAEAPVVAEFGTNWQNNELAKKWRDALIKQNTSAITFCIENEKAKAAIETFVSAKDGGKDANGNQLYEVVANSYSSDPNSKGLGDNTYTYTTGEENGNVVIKDFVIK